MKLGIILIAVSIVWYIAHAMLYNYFLQKNNPELFDEKPQQRGSKKGKKEVTVVMTSGKTPAWVMLIGVPPMPLFVVGVVITVIAFIVGLFK